MEVGVLHHSWTELTLDGANGALHRLLWRPKTLGPQLMGWLGDVGLTFVVTVVIVLVRNDLEHEKLLGHTGTSSQLFPRLGPTYYTTFVAFYQ